MKAKLNKNIKLAGLVLCAITFIVILRLINIQVINADKYKRSATYAQWSDEIVPALRGTIYDANGTVLAQSAKTWKMYVIPEEFQNEEFREKVCSDIADTLGLDCNELMEITEVDVDPDSDELIIAHKKDVKAKIELPEKKLIYCGGDGKDPNDTCLYHRKYTIHITDDEGKTTSKTYKYKDVIGLENDSKRYYPLGEFASSVIGSVDNEGNGVAGIERYYNSLLSGTDGRITSYGTNIDSDNSTVNEAINGTSLKLTIDENLQNILDTNVKYVYESSDSLGAYGIMMNVKTGAILAMDSVGYKGGYDLTNPREVNGFYKKKVDRAVENDDFSSLEHYLGGTEEGDEAINEIKSTEEREKRIELHTKKLNYYYMLEQWNNYVFSETYHPGSVFKIFLTAAAIEENILSPDYTYCCNGSISVEDRIFNCHSAAHGFQDLRHGLMNSCNPFFVKLGLTLGKEKFFEYFKAFGFTEKTGVESLEEANPIYYDDTQLTNVSLSSESFGQTFSVTPIQVITAVSCIANGGKLMQPYLVEEQLDANGNVIKKTAPREKRQVISKETAAEVASMMEDVCKSGTGRNGYVSGYRIAGKTGTTQKYQVRGTYIASFSCFAPADDPEIALLIIADEPKNDMNGSVVCAPAASKIMEASLEYLGVERQYTEEELSKLNTTAPGVIGQNAETASSSLREKGFSVRVIGDGDTVISQNPMSGQTIPKDGVIALYTTDKEEDILKITVPDLRGMSENAVKRYAASEGINVEITGGSGSGVISYDQSILPGESVEYGTIIKIYFKTYENIGDSTDE